MEADGEEFWTLSHRAQRASVDIADRHYNRQHVGSPQFVPPGRCLVLHHEHGSGAVWTTSWPEAQYVKHAWPGAWINSIFRKECDCLASAMILEAVAHTRSEWPDAPDLGMMTFVDASKVEHKRQPGRCYLKAGFRLVGKTKGGLLAFQMLPVDMPDAIQVSGSQMELVP